MTQPGDASQPQDTQSDGTATLADRTEPGGQGSPDTNQGKAEPHPATQHEADPRADRPAPEPGDMTVGSADPQAPSHPAVATPLAVGGGGVGEAAGAGEAAAGGAIGTSEALAPSAPPGPEADADAPE